MIRTDIRLTDEQYKALQSKLIELQVAGIKDRRGKRYSLNSLLLDAIDNYFGLEKKVNDLKITLDVIT